MGVATAKSVFHQPGIAGPENLRAPAAHADLHFSPQVDNQASLKTPLHDADTIRLSLLPCLVVRST